MVEAVERKAGGAGPMSAGYTAAAGAVATAGWCAGAADSGNAKEGGAGGATQSIGGIGAGASPAAAAGEGGGSAAAHIWASRTANAASFKLECASAGGESRISIARALPRHSAMPID